MGGKLQNEDFKTESELISSGGAANQLLNDTKVWVTSGGINKTLDDAINDGDIAGTGLLVSIVSKSADYTVLDGDGYTTFLYDVSGATRTLTLPTAADNTNRQITAKIVAISGTNTLIIDGEGSETIDGQLTYVLGSLYQEITIQCNGTSWYVVEGEQRVVYVKDVKAANTAGGTFTTGAWQTRTLNTLEGDTSFISLSSNRITLDPGEYKIIGSAPARAVDAHKAKLVEDPGGTPSDTAYGSSAFSSSSDSIVTNSFINTRVVITSATTYELQHRGNATRSTDGFGTQSNMGVSEVYSQLEITKLR